MFAPVTAHPFPDVHALGEGPEPHPWLTPLLPYLGRWRGVGRGEYPTLDRPFHYEQEVTFGHDGRPFLHYEARSWLVDPDSGAPLRPSGRETGWWRVAPSGDMETVLAHPTGIVEASTGRVTAGADGPVVDLESFVTACTPVAKEVEGIRRHYALEAGELVFTQEMAAVGVAMSHHLSARLRRMPRG
ncbi:FABP family protein [Streptomyces sp. NPDC089919]|uniref:FABP family protein n=1 Tax=Streptomyces sp. NPDC089919 TaxID=3155188 RepID=UPI0034181BAF